jgi:hypothetical protein
MPIGGPHLFWTLLILTAEHESPQMALDLDAIRGMPILRAIRQQESTLASAPDQLIFLFTTYDPSISSYNADIASVLSALPFLPRQHVNLQDLRRLQHFRSPGSPPIPIPHHLCRAPGPGLLERRLPAILNILLRSHLESRLVLLRDVSADQANRLDARARDLTEDKATRTCFADYWGESGLAEEVFYLTWEAALLRAGILLRYEAILAIPS